jgi:uncharacterized protein YjbI with pentapeptide repeats
LSNFSFNGSKLDGCMFIGTILKHGKFNNVTMTNGYFDKAVLTDASFEKSHFDNVTFDDADLQNAIFDKGTFVKFCSFDHANLGSTAMMNSEFLKCDFSNAILSNTEFSNSNMNDSSFSLSALQENIQVDDNIMRQLIYGVASIANGSRNVSESIKKAILTDEIRGIAQEFINGK